MSNNAPDYENDLVFPPQEIKSQHELSEKGRQSDVLIKAIEKCEKLEKQLKIAIDILEIISTHTIIPDEDTVEQVGMVYNWSSEALNQIEELERCEKN
jgi:hypothetical protein